MTDIVERLRSLSYVSPPRNPSDYSVMIGKDVLIESAAEIERLRVGLKSASIQCGNVIFNCEQQPSSNDRHLASWRLLKDHLDSYLPSPPESKP